MASIRKMRGKWYSRVRWYDNTIGKQKEYLQPLRTDNKTVAHKRNQIVTKYQDDIGSGMEFEFPWMTDGGETKIKEMIARVNHSTGNSKQITQLPPRKWDTKKRLLASIELAGKLIDYIPIISFEDGLNENFKWFRNNLAKVQLSADFPVGMSSAVRK